MPIVRTLLVGAALLSLSAAPALAGGYEEGSGYRTGGSESGRGYGGERYEGDGGYHAWGGEARRTENSYDAWTYRRIDEEPACWREDAPRPMNWRESPTCGTEEVTLPGSFFVDAGGVGGFPETSWGGGGGGFVFAGSGASAHAFASASVSARVSIRFRGGGGHMGHGGHKGGCGCR
jgi:hypothetical protein